MAISRKRKAYLRSLREGSKKGSCYKTKDGIIKQRTDFQRGVSMGRYQVHVEQAKYWNKRKAKA